MNLKKINAGLIQYIKYNMLYNVPNSISCGTEYKDGNKKPLLIDNKIQFVTFEEIELYYITREYVEDIPGRVEELRAIYIEAVEKQKELEAICSRYNSLAVGDLAHIHHDERIAGVIKCIQKAKEI